MVRLLPLVLLIASFSLFGLTWIILDVDPETAQWYILAIFILLIFAAVFCSLGLLLYFLRTRLYKRYSVKWYIYTSFKMAFFVALFMTIVFSLALLQQITIFNLILAILAVSLFAIYSFLGKTN